MSAVSPTTKPVGDWGSAVLRALTAGAALLPPLALLLSASVLALQARPALEAQGWGFFTSVEWNVAQGRFGALPFVYGTLVTSAIAMLVAVPVGIGAATYLAEIAKPAIRLTAGFLVELLAAIPSVVYGFWGIIFLVPLLQSAYAVVGLQATGGRGLLTAGLVLALMVVPYITAVTLDALRAVPVAQRMGAYALGATRWQTIWSVVLPNARSGIIGGGFLALGRALGETMAVAMVIGNSAKLPLSVAEPGYSIPAVIANEMPGAADDRHRSVLVALGLVLFVVSVAINLLARWLLKRTALPSQPASEPPSSANDVPAVKLALAQASIPLPPVSPWPARFNTLMTFVLMLCVVLLMVPLFHIFWQVTSAGSGQLSADFFLHAANTQVNGESRPGLGHAIIGTMMLVGWATVIAAPMGVLAAVYCVEYRKTKLAKAARFCAEILTGVPSVLVGLVAHAMLIQLLGRWLAPHPTGWAGVFALSIMMMPIVLRTAEEALLTVPDTLRRASYALGATPAQTILRVILPAAATAIVTGVFLGMARIAGETAPLLFTAGNSNYWQPGLEDGIHPLFVVSDMSERVPFLTYYIYNYAMSAKLAEQHLAWCGAFVLLTFVLAVNIAMRVVAGRGGVAASRSG
ncbi:MAG: phosphate ABC transporter permease subunit PstC [Planctomycetota bacterium]